jgi:hypothetical protein
MRPKAGVFGSCALDYFDHGWYPIPGCWPGATGACSCGRRHPETGAPLPHAGRDVGKAPIIAYKKFFKTPPTRDRVRGWAWWRPMANLNILLEPSWLVVIDLDSDEAIKEAEQLGTPRGPRVRTQHGGHVYTRRPAGCPVRRATHQGTTAKIDVLGHGYVVAPPSRHARGHVYAWEIPPRAHPLEETPRWAVDILCAAQEPLDQVATIALPEDLAPVPLATLPVSDRIKRLIIEGHDARYPSPSESRFAVLQALVTAGCTDAEIATVMLDEAHTIGAKARHEGRVWLGREIVRARLKSDVEVFA